MRNKPLKGLMSRSPLKQDQGVDTTWADQVFDPEKVDRALVKKGLHTDKRVGRGTVNTSTGMTNASVNNAMIDMSI